MCPIFLKIRPLPHTSAVSKTNWVVDTQLCIICASSYFFLRAFIVYTMYQVPYILRIRVYEYVRVRARTSTSTRVRALVSSIYHSIHFLFLRPLCYSAPVSLLLLSLIHFLSCCCSCCWCPLCRCCALSCRCCFCAFYSNNSLFFAISAVQYFYGVVRRQKGFFLSPQVAGTSGWGWFFFIRKAAKRQFSDRYF